ncbi:MAG: 3-hydroxyacyl-ACP dehydratase FabZ family protein [Planctomycetia bacterium]|nr:3-hydroxyacyl-ACP dehydratase FabZ family protein [Planctomycetia bacterium]
MTHDDILNAIPHRPPFLFVDEILQWEEEKIVCQYTFKEDEFFFKGHYPGSPIVPGVILCESAMQCGAILLSKIFRNSESGPDKVPVVARMGDVRFKNPVFPTNTVTIEVEFKERMGSAYFMAAKLTNQGKIVLRFDFSCTATERPATNT